MTTIMDAGTDNAGVTPKTKKPYHRIITDKRRQQNRDSQKKYRERLKARLEDLEDQVAAQNQQAKGHNDQHGSLTRAETGHSIRTTSTVPSSDFDTPFSMPVDQEPPTTLIDLNAVFEAAGDLALPTGTTQDFAISLQYPTRAKPTNLPFLVPDYPYDDDDSTYSSAAASSRRVYGPLGPQLARLPHDLARGCVGADQGLHASIKIVVPVAVAVRWWTTTSPLHATGLVRVVVE